MVGFRRQREESMHGARPPRHAIASGFGVALIGLLLATVPARGSGAIDAAWQGTHWGERSDELARQFGARATVLAKPIDFGDSYAEVVLRNHLVGGYPFTVFFQMDKASHGLKRVQLERQRHGANPKVARALLAELTASYGPPDRSCDHAPRGRNGYQAAAERSWTRDGTLIRAIARDTTLAASEGCLFSDASAVGACGLTGQLLVRISPAEMDAPACR
jgi:hypothetical protein